MAYISPKDGFQIYFTSLEEGISKDNPVHFIDAFVDVLELSKLSFIVEKSKLKDVLHLILRYF